MTDDSDTDEPKSPWWIKAVNSLGLPTVLLGAMILMLYRGGVWVGDNVAVPVVRKQIEFIESAASVNQDMLKITEEIRDTMKAQQSHGDTAVEELRALAIGIVANNQEIRENRELLKASAVNDAKSLQTLESIDKTLKNQQLLLQELPKQPQK